MARRLREARAAAFPSGAAFARYLQTHYPDAPWHQTRVSKLERGEQRPTETDLTQWITATAAGDTADELWSLLASSRVEYATFGAAYARNGSAAADQARHGAQEAATSRIRSYQPALVPGLLQTTAYARDMLTVPTGPGYFGATRADIEAMAHARIQRQDVVYDPAKTVQIILGEAALHTRFGNPSVQRGQLDRLVDFAALDTLELGVIPFEHPAPVFPLSGFVVHDDAVMIETLAGEQTLDDPTDVALYAEAFTQLREAALTGDDAIAVIRRVRDTLT